MYTPLVMLPMLALAFAAPALHLRAVGDNVQTFTGTLGGAAPAVLESAGDRPFSVDGSTFVKAKAAVQRSCAVQANACSTAANAKTIEGGVAVCNTQKAACDAANTN